MIRTYPLFCLASFAAYGAADYAVLVLTAGLCLRNRDQQPSVTTGAMSGGALVVASV